MNFNKYFDIFKISEQDLNRLIGTALNNGGDYADLYFENTYSSNINLIDSEVSSGGIYVDYGAGIRVLNGDKTGYAYSETTDMQSLMSAAKSASIIANGYTGNIPIMNSTIYKDCINNFYPSKMDWNEVKMKEFTPFLKSLGSMIESKDERVIKVAAYLAYSTSHILMYNSFGELSCDYRPICSVSCSAVFTENGKTETKSASRSFRMGAEMLNEDLLNELVNDVLKGVDDKFIARRPKGGEMPIVMAAGASGILLHEAMGHSFEADFIRKGQSIFTDKIGELVCNTDINIVDDGTIIGNRGSCNFDDEGIEGQKTYMVKDGVLNSYLHDRISAKHFGVSPTGNGRRESFRYYPIPRMRATYMENGKEDPAEIIRSVKQGIYVSDFSNGQVKIGEGDFTFYVQGGYMIEDGKLTYPIKDINVIGNGPKALADIIAVGNDKKIDNGTWTCGKDQSAYVSCGIPTVLVKNLIVGGE